MAIANPQEHEEGMTEERREQLRRDPNVIVHRRPPGPVTPYEPQMRVLGEVDILKLIGRHCDEDTSDKRQSWYDKSCEPPGQEISMAIANPQEQNEGLTEERLEELRRDPRVIVHRRPPGPFVPYKPAIRVLNDVDVLKLIGRYDDECDGHHESEPDEE